MLTVLFVIAMAGAFVSGTMFYSNHESNVTRQDKIAAIVLGASVLLLVLIAYIAGAR